MKQNTNENDTIERYTHLSDFVAVDKPTSEMSFVYNSREGDIDVDIKFIDGRADAFVDSDIDFLDKEYTHVKILPDENGNVALSLQDTIEIIGKDAIQGTQKRIAKIGLSISDNKINEFESKLEEHQEEIAEWTQKAEEKSAATTLKFQVVNHEYRKGTWRTKYNMSEVVLRPNKAKHLMTDEEKTHYEALCMKLDTADDYPIAPSRFDAGDVLTIDDIAVSDAVDKIKKQKETKAKKEEIVDEHSQLHNVDFDLYKFDRAKEEAIRTGDKQAFHEQSSRCNDKNKECNLDIVTYYITEDCSVETTHTHTF